MREVLEKKLDENFPFMKKERTLSEQKNENNYISDLYHGLSCGDGWYNLVHDLCTEIMEAYKEAGREIDIEIYQIKEKFGTLRFYYGFKSQPRRIQGFDFIGIQGVGGVRITPRENGFEKKISDIVRKYEKMSAEVCEICGKPGRLRKDLNWIRTCCDGCYIIEKIGNREHK